MKLEDIQKIMDLIQAKVQENQAVILIAVEAESEGSVNGISGVIGNKNLADIAIKAATNNDEDFREIFLSNYSEMAVSEIKKEIAEMVMARARPGDLEKKVRELLEGN